MPSVNGILETAIYCRDVHVTAAFYRKLFCFTTLLESDRLIAFDVAGRSVLLLFAGGATDAPFQTPGGIIPGHSGSGRTHFAFGISAADVEPWKQRLSEAGVALESTVHWPGGADSLYFRDPDEHAVELITPGFWKV